MSYDPLLESIADYVLEYTLEDQEALETARYCTWDALGCAMLALQFPACTQRLGPICPDQITPNGCKVPGTSYVLDPVQGAFHLGAMIRWLDFNDTWLAAEWGHPSDNLGAILSLAEYLSRQGSDIRMRDVFQALVLAYEVQGTLALENAFNRVGLDHVILVKLASTAACARLMGLNRSQTLSALSHVFVDGQSLRTYRHAPNACPRKSWAAGDACARAVWLTEMAKRGEQGIPSVLSVPEWGFQDVSFRGKKVILNKEMSQYIMSNVLWKVSFPAEFHAQTAVEAAVQLSPCWKKKGKDSLKEIRIRTHESAIRIIDKKGPLKNPAARDHCLQYMVACGLYFGTLIAEHYNDSIAYGPEGKILEALRSKMVIREDPDFTKDYLDPEKRSIANAVQLVFEDGEETEEICIEYPLGHKRRRKEAIPHLTEKCRRNLSTRFSEEQTEKLMNWFDHPSTLDALPVSVFVDSWHVEKA